MRRGVQFPAWSPLLLAVLTKPLGVELRPLIRATQRLEDAHRYLAEMNLPVMGKGALIDGPRLSDLGLRCGVCD